jgi:hypothetical protein
MQRSVTCRNAPDLTLRSTADPGFRVVSHTIMGPHRCGPHRVRGGADWGCSRSHALSPTLPLHEGRPESIRRFPMEAYLGTTLGQQVAESQLQGLGVLGLTRLVARNPSRCSLPCGHLCADPRNSYLCSGVMGEYSAEEQGGDSTILGCTSRVVLPPFALDDVNSGGPGDARARQDKADDGHLLTMCCPTRSSKQPIAWTRCWAKALAASSASR